jgi:hypothetical protein
MGGLKSRPVNLEVLSSGCDTRIFHKQPSVLEKSLFSKFEAIL